MASTGKEGHERPPRISRLWLLLLLVPVVGGFVCERVQIAIRERQLDPAKVDWAAVREEALANGRALRAEQESGIRQKVLDAHKANVEACVERAVELLPGLLPSPLAKAKIEADCAEAEGRAIQAGHLPASP